MSSQNASDTIEAATTARAKAPQRERGRARVAALLEAAGQVFAEKGYDAATMTAIAARGGSSIGSLYQFFPTKDEVAQALLQRYLDALMERMHQLRIEAADLDGTAIAGFAARLTRTFIRFRGEHPAFAMLAESYGTVVPGAGSIRSRIRAELGAVLRALAPAQSEAQAEARAAVIQHLMKAAVAINGDTEYANRDAAIVELEHLVEHSLRSWITPTDG
ncbi:MAG TPA: TetR/AcrR family transcriptional regulator [Pararobbsia sp.]|jgi:AcrR family transcriptional regulator|nr:TetR/AcrR family transcriptional regulator [Pararobbsia sp.]